MTAPSPQKKGPASAPTLPSHGSANTLEGLEMNKHSNTTAAAETAMVETRDLDAAVSLLIKGIHLNELIYTAGAGIYHESVREKGEAIMTGADILKDILGEVKDVLYAVMDGKAGAA